MQDGWISLGMWKCWRLAVQPKTGRIWAYIEFTHDWTGSVYDLRALRRGPLRHAWIRAVIYLFRPRPRAGGTVIQVILDRLSEFRRRWQIEVDGSQAAARLDQYKTFEDRHRARHARIMAETERLFAELREEIRRCAARDVEHGSR